MASNNQIKVNSPNVKYSDDYISVDYEYTTANVGKLDDKIVVCKKKIFFLLYELWIMNEINWCKWKKYLINNQSG